MLKKQQIETSLYHEHLLEQELVYQKAKASLSHERLKSSEKLCNDYIWKSADDTLQSHLEKLPPLPKNRPIIDNSDKL